MTCDPACDTQCQTCRESDGTCVDVAQGDPCDDGDPATVGDTCGQGRQSSAGFSCQSGTRTVVLTVSQNSSTVRPASRTLPLYGLSEHGVVLADGGDAGACAGAGRGGSGGDAVVRGGCGLAAGRRCACDASDNEIDRMGHCLHLRVFFRIFLPFHWAISVFGVTVSRFAFPALVA